MQIQLNLWSEQSWSTNPRGLLRRFKFQPPVLWMHNNKVWKTRSFSCWSFVSVLCWNLENILSVREFILGAIHTGQFLRSPKTSCVKNWRPRSNVHVRRHNLCRIVRLSVGNKNVQGTPHTILSWEDCFSCARRPRQREHNESVEGVYYRRCHKCYWKSHENCQAIASKLVLKESMVRIGEWVSVFYRRDCHKYYGRHCEHLAKKVNGERFQDVDVGGIQW